MIGRTPTTITVASLLVLACTTALANPTATIFTKPGRGLNIAEPFELAIVVEGAEGEVRQPKIPTIEGLRVLQGPSRGETHVWSNGRTSRSVSFGYLVAANRTGTIRIPSIEIRAGGVALATEPFAVEVAEAPAAPAPGARDRRGREDRDAARAQDVRIRARLDRDRLYVGQPATLELELLTGVAIEGTEILDEPELAEFWVEEAQVRPGVDDREVTVDGRRYRRYILQRKVLVPTRQGEFRIDPFVLRLAVRRTTGDPFADMMRGMRPLVITRQTTPATLSVDALPDAGRPEDFSGAVGDFEMTTTLDRDHARVDDAVALRVRVNGEGFLHPAGPPALESSAQLRVNEPRTEQDATLRGGALRSTKSWEWLVVPLSSGELPIPPLRFSYFDPEAGEYRTKTSPDLLLAVEGGGEGGATRVASGALQPVREDIRFIKPLLSPLRAGTARVHARPWFPAIAFGPILALPFAVGAARWYGRARGDRVRRRSKRAKRRAFARLAKAEKLVDAETADAFHDEVSRAVFEYVGDRFDTSATGLTYDATDALLESKGVDAALRAEIRGFLERCDFARYVPSSSDAGNRRDMLEAARSIVRGLERAL